VTLGIMSPMNAWPPHPGLTVIISTISTFAASGSDPTISTSIGVTGLMEMPQNIPAAYVRAGPDTVWTPPKPHERTLTASITLYALMGFSGIPTAS